jgi:hypothetical protein
MKRTVIALSLALAAALSTPCDNAKDKVLPDGTKVFGERTLPDGTVKAERKEFPDGRKHFDVTVLPDGTRKIGRVEYPDGQKNFDVTVLPDGSTKVEHKEFPDGRKLFDVAVLPDGTTKIGRGEFANGQKNFDATILPNGSESTVRIEYPNGQVQIDVTVLPDGTRKIGRVEYPDGQKNFDVTLSPNGTEIVGRTTKPDGTATAQQPAVGARPSASAQAPRTAQKETNQEGAPALTKDARASGPGPFGFRRGMTREQIIKLVGKAAIDSSQTQDDILAVRKAPVPDPAFEEYWLIISPTEGVLKVTGVGITVKTDPFGTELRAAYMNAVGAVTRKYGDTKGIADGCIAHPKNSTEAHFGCLYPDSYLLDLNNGAPVARVWMESLKARGPRSDRVVYVRVKPYVGELKYFDPPIRASVFRKTGLSIAGASGYLLVEYAFDGFDEYLVSSGQVPNPATLPATVPYGAIQ